MRKGILTFIIFALLTTACDNKNSSNNNNNGTPPTLPDVENLTLNVPANAAAIVKAQVNAVNGLVSSGIIAASFVVLGTPQIDGNTYTWTTTTPDGISYSVAATKLDNDMVSWTYILNGTSSTDSNVSYDNWQALNGTSSSDGKTGEWTLFAENSTEPALTVDWTSDASGNREVISTSYFENENHVLTYNENADSSGSLTVKEGDDTTLESEWDASGAGSFTQYLDGQVVDSGEWTGSGN